MTSQPYELFPSSMRASLKMSVNIEVFDSGVKESRNSAKVIVKYRKGRGALFFNRAAPIEQQAGIGWDPFSGACLPERILLQSQYDLWRNLV